MNAVHAIYERGVFRPLGPVSIPEGSEVWFEPWIPPLPGPSTPRESVSDEELDALYAILGRSHDLGVTDFASTIDEHQP